MRLAPGWFVAALLAFSAFAALGTWQLQRGLGKRDRLTQQAAAERADAARPLAEVLAAPDAGGVQRVAGRGRYERLLLLDNQQRAGRVGLRVYGVAAVDGAAPRLLVDLGWIAMPPDRRAPRPALPAGERELRGLLAPWPGQGLRLGDNPWPENPGAAPLLTYLDRTELQRELRVPLGAGVLRLDPALDYGWARDADLLPNTLPPERHYGYAVQWYALAAAVAVIYFVLRRRAQRRTSA
jgi:surfeit locus 1 family protein